MFDRKSWPFQFTSLFKNKHFIIDRLDLADKTGISVMAG